MVGLQVLVLTIGVRIPVPEPRKIRYAHRVAGQIYCVTHSPRATQITPLLELFVLFSKNT